MTNDNVIVLNKDHVNQIVSVLCDSFHDYPVMRYVLINDNDYDNRLNILINFFVMARALRNETIFGIKDSTGLTGVATTSNPAVSMQIPSLSELREQTWRILGTAAKARYEKLGTVWADLDIDIPNIHLNMLGVKQDRQKTGAARKLIDRVHQFSLRDPQSKGVTLTTEDPNNVGFYEYLGYKITGHAKVDNDLETWNFFRPD